MFGTFKKMYVDGLEVFDSLGAMLPNDRRRHALELAPHLEKRSFPHRSPKAVRVTNDQGALLFGVPIRRSA